MHKRVIGCRLPHVGLVALSSITLAAMPVVAAASGVSSANRGSLSGATPKRVLLTSGYRLLSAVERGNQTVFFLLEADGRTPARTVAKITGSFVDIAVSPTGKRLAALVRAEVAPDQPNPGGLYVFSPSAGRPERLVSYGDKLPRCDSLAWNTESEIFCFSRPFRSFAYKISTRTREITPVSPRCPSFYEIEIVPLRTTDGKLYLSCHGAIYGKQGVPEVGTGVVLNTRLEVVLRDAWRERCMILGTGTPLRVPGDPLDLEVCDWSHRGDQLAFVSGSRLLIGPSPAANAIEVGRNFGLAAGDPTWSPDDRLLLVRSGDSWFVKTIALSGLPFRVGRAPGWHELRSVAWWRDSKHLLQCGLTLRGADGCTIVTLVAKPGREIYGENLLPGFVGREIFANSNGMLLFEPESRRTRLWNLTCSGQPFPADLIVRSKAVVWLPAASGARAGCTRA